MRVTQETFKKKDSW